MSKIGLGVKDFVYWSIFTFVVITIGVFFVVPFVKHRNFVNYLVNAESSKTLQGSVISVSARYEGENENFIDYNGDKRLHPGSNFKLFTAAASLTFLKPDFTFATKLYSHARGAKIDLILVGGGDPSFKRTDFTEFVEVLKKKSVKNFGDIYYDDSYFNGEQYGPGWDLNWRDQYFSVPISGLQINDNLLDIRAGEIENSGKFGVETGPLENYGRILDDLIYFDDSSQMKLPVTARMNDEGMVVLEGDSMKDLPFKTSTTIGDPSLFTAMVFKQELVKAGLVSKNARVLPYAGDVNEEELIFEYKSPPLKEIVFKMLKFSKNNYAETLVRTLGNEAGVEGSQAEGVIVLNDFAAEIGLDDGEISAFDGSALSPYTRITGNAILKLFVFVDNQDWKDIFWNSLPESQKDGTLKYRFETAGLKHPVIGKTGTHEFSSSLSGKILRKADGRKNILFSVHIYNHPYDADESVIKVRPVIDKIVALLDKQF